MAYEIGLVCDEYVIIEFSSEGLKRSRLVKRIIMFEWIPELFTQAERAIKE